MPRKPPRVCPRCQVFVPAGRRCPCNPAKRSPTADVVGRTARWRKLSIVFAHRCDVVHKEPIMLQFNGVLDIAIKVALLVLLIIVILAIMP
jgi:hypothetical protein